MTPPKILNETISQQITAWVEEAELLDALTCSMPCDEPCENPVICFFVMIAGEDQMGVGATCLPHISQLAVFGEVLGGELHERPKVHTGSS